jgi:hypothetical protein
MRRRRRRLIDGKRHFTAENSTLMRKAPLVSTVTFPGAFGCQFRRHCARERATVLRLTAVLECAVPL